MHRYVERMPGRQERHRAARDFNMRWIASLVAEVHRILMRGGVFMYPRDTRDRTRPGRLRLLYEANPIGMLVEQAGGRASTGRQRLLGVSPEGAAPARAADPRLAPRSRAHRALPRRVPERRRPAVHLAAVQRALAVPSRSPDLSTTERRMSVQHPIIAVTGSSGAGTTTVMQSFAHIFRREGIKAQVIEGDSFHRYNRVEMRERMQAADRGAGPQLQPLRPRGQPAARARRHLRRVRRGRARPGTPLRARCRRGPRAQERPRHLHRRGSR